MLRKSNLFQRKFRGFTILELAVVITVFGLIASTSLSYESAKLSAAKLRQTKENTKAIMEVIRDFVRTNGYLPCPADGSLALTNANYGVATGSGDAATGDCPSGGGVLAIGNIRVGVLPVHSLGLSPATFDGWGRRFTYVMDQRFTGLTFYADSNNKGGDITIIDGAGANVANGADPNNDPRGAVVILLSHGLNGHGAWKSEGVDVIDEALEDTAEQQNAKCRSILTTNCTNNATFIQKANTPSFDDVLEWRWKYHLCEMYGASPDRCKPI